MRLWLKRILGGLAGLLVLAYVLVTFVVAPYWLGGMAATRRFQFPDKENADLTPASFQLSFEDVSFKSSDGTELKGVVGPRRAGQGHRRAGPRPEPLAHRDGAAGALRPRGGLERAALIDLRHHGASGGEATTFGAKEKEDVQAAASFARERSPGPVVVWGVSLGGASVAMAAADDPDGRGRDLRQQLPLASRHRRVTTWPSSAASAGGCVSCPPGRCADQVALLDRPPRRASTRARWTSWRLPRTSRAGPALFVANSDDRRMPKEIAFDAEDGGRRHRRGAGRAGQEPRRRLARRNRGLPRPRPWY